jgi:hypothetical protein
MKHGKQAPDHHRRPLGFSRRWQARYYLLELEGGFVLGGEQVRQVVVAPRYSGDELEQAMTEDCVVGIARVRGGVSLNAGESFTPEDVCYIAIGRISLAADKG